MLVRLLPALLPLLCAAGRVRYYIPADVTTPAAHRTYYEDHHYGPHYPGATTDGAVRGGGKLILWMIHWTRTGWTHSQHVESLHVVIDTRQIEGFFEVPSEQVRLIGHRGGEMERTYDVHGGDGWIRLRGKTGHLLNVELDLVLTLRRQKDEDGPRDMQRPLRGRFTFLPSFVRATPETAKRMKTELLREYRAGGIHFEEVDSRVAEEEAEQAFVSGEVLEYDPYDEEPRCLIRGRTETGRLIFLWCNYKDRGRVSIHNAFIPIEGHPTFREYLQD
jgi:hypothetical protein